MAASVKLPPIVRSPSVVQYAKPYDTTKPFYRPRFRIPAEVYKSSLQSLKKTDPLMPPYPYGSNMTFKEANIGLYGGATIQSGHKISKGRNKGKTLRKWFPNVRIENIKSEALGETLQIPITARTLRTINKCGGLDQYLLGDKPARIKELGLLGWKLRWKVMNAPSMKEKFADERQMLGLPQQSPLTESFTQVWQDAERRQKMIDQQDAAWTKLREKAEKFESILVETSTFISAMPIQPRRLATLLEHSPSSLGLPETIEEEGQRKEKAKVKKSSRSTRRTVEGDIKEDVEEGETV